MIFSLLKPADWKAVLMGTMQEWKSKVKTAQSYVYGLSDKCRDYRLQDKLG